MFISARPGLVTEPSCLEELPPSLREELLSLGAWIRDGLLQGGQIAFIQCSEKTKVGF